MTSSRGHEDALSIQKSEDLTSNLSAYYTKLDLCLTPAFYDRMRKKSGLLGTSAQTYQYEQIRPGVLHAGLGRAEIPYEDYKDCPIIHDLVTHFSTRAIVWRLPSYYWLAWHTDKTRNSTINIPLEDHDDRFTVFQNEITEFGEAREVLSGTMHRVNYELGYACLLNTLRPHAVYNLKQHASYIVSIGIAGVPVYEDVVKYCQNYVVP